MEKPVIIENLRHSFNGHFALRDLMFDVQLGEVFALLGPNGAGKTTTIRLLNGLYKPSAGKIRVFGMDPVVQGSQVRAQCGVLTETSALYERLTARENLEFFGRLYGLPESLLLKRSAEILEFFSLDSRADDRVGTFSKGMKQRLALARAFFTHPRLLYLDEPTASLDPESALQVHELIENLRKEGDCTVFLCTHHLQEAERLADRVAILHNGQLLALGSLEDLGRKFSQGWRVEIETMSPLEVDTQSIAGVLGVERNGRVTRMEVREESIIPGLVRELVNKGAEITGVRSNKPSLEDIYFKLQADARNEEK